MSALPVQPGDIYSVAFSPDGSRIAIGNADGYVRVYDTHSARLELTLGQLGNGPSSMAANHLVSGVAFSPDGSMLAATTRAGPAHVWALDVDELEAIARTELTRAFTTEECRQFLHLDPCPIS